MLRATRGTHAPASHTTSPRGLHPIHMNLSGAHGSANGILIDGVIQEIDVKTGLVMWEWHALGNIPLSESNVAARASGYPWDYVHLNSADPGPAGDVLLSSRN